MQRSVYRDVVARRRKTVRCPWAMALVHPLRFSKFSGFAFERPVAPHFYLISHRISSLPTSTLPPDADRADMRKGTVSRRNRWDHGEHNSYDDDITHHQWSFTMRAPNPKPGSHSDSALASCRVTVPELQKYSPALRSLAVGLRKE